MLKAAVKAKSPMGKTLYAQPGRKAHLSALITDIEAEIRDIDEAIDGLASNQAFMATSGPVGGILGATSADRHDAFARIRGMLADELRLAENELARTVESLVSEEDIERFERSQREIEIEVGSRRDTYARAIAQFSQQNDHRSAATYAFERAMARAALAKQWEGR
ncbi:hypothetical protein [Mesorhizobium sp. B1-1-8]|uniref:hypothetical protein n=1 Tax=Mesorhizobium sp. B1-1-8 TaxID=2589976 RepID=UPI001125E9E2|nr:hypothetical protein [Mesorhizobium sp. B1-1-8]UCI09979.1 hypothetical protein FJ974_13455 [Mesorhizobium sp. B1-1-8]